MSDVTEPDLGDLLRSASERASEVARGLARRVTINPVAEPDGSASDSTDCPT
jgi:hypothetical protein